MRMRKKKWAVPELMASPLYIKEPESYVENGSRLSKKSSLCM